MAGGVLVVDGANVVGSVPDGWWRDRAGAARRLHTDLVEAELPWGEVVLVLEGAARAGVDAGTVGRVRTVHASMSGDDEIVRQAREVGVSGAVVSVATADRGLIGRVDPAVEIIGPRHLRSSLD